MIQELRPTFGRLLVAFAIAPAVGAVALWLIAVSPQLVQLLQGDAEVGFKQFMAIGLVMNLMFLMGPAYLVTIVIAIPLYWVLFKLRRISGLALMLLGSLSGFLLGLVFDRGPQIHTSEIGALCGLAAGVAFYLIIRAPTSSDKRHS